MAKMKQSEVAARLAIDGTVAALGGAVKGELGLTPRQLGPGEKADLAMANVGTTLFYEIEGGNGVFFHADGPFTTIWYGGQEATRGIAALDAAIKRLYPKAKTVGDGPHATERNFDQRTYDIQLPNDKLAIVDAIYPAGPVANPKFMVRIAAMTKQQKK
jgi:hypothetical protein